jgi:hypothetical protein
MSERTLTIGDKVTLYDSIYDRDCRGVHWVTKALKRRTGTKFHTSVLYVKNGIVTATNAHRMHRYRMYNFKRLQDGFYKVGQTCTVKKVQLIFQGSFQEYPEMDEMFIRPKDAEELTGAHNMLSDVSKIYTNIVRSMVDDYTIDYGYLKDALYKKAFWYVHVNYQKPDSPVLLIDSVERKWAVIQPIGYRV